MSIRKMIGWGVRIVGQVFLFALTLSHAIFFGGLLVLFGWAIGGIIGIFLIFSGIVVALALLGMNMIVTDELKKD